MIIDYSLIIAENYKNYKWVCIGTSYEGINWTDEFPKPTKEKLDSQWNEVLIKHKKENCKRQSKQLISNSDWSVLPDVNLQNKSDFQSYRSKLRELIVNPVENPVFPIEPDPIWSK